MNPSKEEFRNVLRSAGLPTQCPSCGGDFSTLHVGKDANTMMTTVSAQCQPCNKKILKVIDNRFAREQELLKSETAIRQLHIKQQLEQTKTKLQMTPSVEQVLPSALYGYGGGEAKIGVYTPVRNEDSSPKYEKQKVADVWKERSTKPKPKPKRKQISEHINETWGKTKTGVQTASAKLEVFRTKTNPWLGRLRNILVGLFFREVRSPEVEKVQTTSEKLSS